MVSRSPPTTTQSFHTADDHEWVLGLRVDEVVLKAGLQSLRWLVDGKRKERRRTFAPIGLPTVFGSAGRTRALRSKPVEAYARSRPVWRLLLYAWTNTGSGVATLFEWFLTSKRPRRHHSSFQHGKVAGTLWHSGPREPESGSRIKYRVYLYPRGR